MSQKLWLKHSIAPQNIKTTYLLDSSKYSGWMFKVVPVLDRLEKIRDLETCGTRLLGHRRWTDGSTCRCNNAPLSPWAPRPHPHTHTFHLRPSFRGGPCVVDTSPAGMNPTEGDKFRAVLSHFINTVNQMTSATSGSHIWQIVDRIRKKNPTSSLMFGVVRLLCVKCHFHQLFGSVTKPLNLGARCHEMGKKKKTSSKHYHLVFPDGMSTTIPAPVMLSWSNIFKKQGKFLTAAG